MGWGGVVGGRRHWARPARREHGTPRCLTIGHGAAGRRGLGQGRGGRSTPVARALAAPRSSAGPRRTRAQIAAGSGPRAACSRSKCGQLSPGHPGGPAGAAAESGSSASRATPRASGAPASAAAAATPGLVAEARTWTEAAGPDSAGEAARSSAALIAIANTLRHRVRAAMQLANLRGGRTPSRRRRPNAMPARRGAIATGVFCAAGVSGVCPISGGTWRGAWAGAASAKARRVGLCAGRRRGRPQRSA